MSFKRVHEGRFNKVIFAVFLEDHGKVITLLHIKDRGTLGLGKCLQELDPEHHEPDWQLERILIFCQVYFIFLFKAMISLLYAPTRAQYMDILEQLLGKQTHQKLYAFSRKHLPILKAVTRSPSLAQIASQNYRNQQASHEQHILDLLQSFSTVSC
ncbi:predicted protein [Aspergillus nidulans FGSC A4]|uniref:Uncharacterized protein n=1 Tax=Emericella nidulans (strain FGSC A4 / ATCC 38163 / CBS 112.46 / NRRL 194 / M139) TaxID=227321 RepID=Q5AZ06_EMENI|nr:hypothetical protein [Aspergillus nidulans FGSC A4]EAA58496.1 predicted protein [Aspergillus nidulans FGSC A4]CBF69388.1 TPA: hypothetical protein ANIA_06474 [Aspergillus nidulans FGSC A4]|eukprot:XP_664078.1 predicted protein [Aspergillus nidulans FGSC A4]